MKRIWFVLVFSVLLTLTFSSVTRAERLPDTAQTKCYNDQQGEISPCPLPGEPFYGQDGNYVINAPSYTKLGQNGVELPDTATPEEGWLMTRDNVTGLIWEVKTGESASHTYTWGQTTVFLQELNGNAFGGYGDWRLPQVKELTGITARNTYNPAVNTGFFPNTPQGQFSLHWTSTDQAGDDDHAWVVGFYQGHFTADFAKSTSWYVRAVRGEPLKESLFRDNGDGTVTDESTGLMWLQQTGGPMTWSDALAYCESLPITQSAGYSDWRLPNVIELQSLVDYDDDTEPVIDGGVFPDAQAERYWSSTSRASSPANAWVVDFRDGESDTENKSDLEDTYYVRAVRGGQNQLPGHLFITSPSQATRWVIGRAMDITWETPPEVTGNVKIAVSHDGGKTFDTVTPAEGTANDGAYDWTVTGPDSFNVMVKIEPVDEPFQGMGTTQGLLKVETNQAPSEPADPSPADQAEDQSTDTDISWAASTDPDPEDTVTYKVYFGTSSALTDPVATGYTPTTYDPGTLKCNATYYWKIVACDNNEGCTEGPVWRFSTPSVPGDVNGDCQVDLTDAVLAFEVVIGLEPGEPVLVGADVNGDGKIGVAEVLYILQVIANLRTP